MFARAVVCALLLPSLALASTPDAPRASGLSAVLIGATGAALAGGYAAGAFALGQQPGAAALAGVGGGLVGGLAGVSVALAINSMRRDPGSLVRYVMAPVLAGLVGAAVGALGGAFGAAQPGAGRVVTHVVVVSLLLTETVVLEIVH